MTFVNLGRTVRPREQTIADWGLTVDRKKLEEAYFATRAVPGRQHDSVVKRWPFSATPTILSNQVLFQHENAEPRSFVKAKEFIQEHQAEDIILQSPARSTPAPFISRKITKKITGINFTDYSRV
jgi:hypothetical protein